MVPRFGDNFASYDIFNDYTDEYSTNTQKKRRFSLTRFQSSLTEKGGINDTFYQPIDSASDWHKTFKLEQLLIFSEHL